MEMESGVAFTWPIISETASIVAIVLAAVIFVFGLFSGARANKFRMIFAVVLATAIGWFSMPLAVKAARALQMLDSGTGVVILVTMMMVFVAVLATNIYEIITVTLSDVGMASKK